jgi:hypothetical protein
MIDGIREVDFLDAVIPVIIKNVVTIGDLQRSRGVLGGIVVVHGRDSRSRARITVDIREQPMNHVMSPVRNMDGIRDDSMIHAVDLEEGRLLVIQKV